MKAWVFASLLCVMPLVARAQTPVRGWSRLWGSATNDYVTAVATDGGGNSYVAGYTLGGFDGHAATDRKAYVRRIDARGEWVWTRFLDTVGSDEAHDVALGPDGMIYVTGRTWGAFKGFLNLGASDIFLAKLAPDGSVEWIRQYGTASVDEGRGVCVGANDAIFVTGLASGSVDGQTHAGGRDLLLSRFTSDGSRTWSRLWGSASHDYANDVTVASDGDVYVTGYSSASIDGQPFAGSSDVFLTKFKSGGTKLWTAMWGSSGVEQANGVTVDASNAVYVVGQGGAFHGQQAIGSADVFLTKFSAADTWQWTRIFGSVWDDYGFDVHVGPNQRIYVAGHAPPAEFDGVPASHGGVFLAARGADGARLWTQRWGPADSEARGVQAVASQSIFVAGTTPAGMEGLAGLGLEDGFLTRLDAPAVTEVAAVWIGGDMRALALRAETEGDLDRVEFYLDGMYMGTDYSAPYGIEWHPSQAGLTWDMLAGDHLVRARAFDVDDKEFLCDADWRWNNDCTDIVPEVSMTFPWGRHRIYTETGYAPSEDVLLEAEASVLDIHLNPLTGVFEERNQPVDRVRFHVDGVFLGETNAPVPGTSHTFQMPFNTGGLDLGSHSVTAYGYSRDCVGTDRSHIVVEGPPYLRVSRDVQVCENALTIEVTVENTGDGAARHVTVTDSLLGLQVAAETGNADITGYSYDPATRRSSIDVFLGRIETNESATFSYRAVPVLYDGVEEYEIGGDSKVLYTDLSGAAQEWDIWETPDQVTLCGHPRLQPLSSQVDASITRADYLLVTNPQNLLGLYDADDVALTLAKMAELALYRNGVLGYYGTRLPIKTAYRSGDLLAMGNLFNDGYRELILWDVSEPKIHVYDRYEEILVETDPPTDPPTYVLPFDLAYHAGDALAAGDVLPTKSDGTRHGGHEIVVARGSGHGASAGTLRVYSYGHVPGSRTFSTFTEDVGYEDGDQLLVANVLLGGAYEENTHEIVLLSADGTLSVFEGLSDAPAVQVATVYEAGDPVAVGNLLGDEAAEILVVDRSMHHFFIYQASGGTLVDAGASWLGDDWNEDCAAAVADVTGDGRAEILFADPEAQTITVWGYVTSLGWFSDLGEFDHYFRASDPLLLLAANVMGSGKAEILVPRARSDHGYAAGEISAISYSDSEVAPGDRYSLDALINEGGDWAEALDLAGSAESWAADGHLLLVGEEMIVPTFSGSWDPGSTDYTDKDYANTTGDYYPELAMGRIIGHRADRLAAALQSAIDIARGAVPFEVGNAYAVNGSRRGPGGDSDRIKFDETRERVADSLAAKGFTVLERNEPSVATFLSDARNKDMIFMLAHGWYGGWEEVNTDHIDASFDPGTRRPFIYANSCSTALYAGHYSLAEAFLRHGASGYIGATATSISPWSGRLIENFAARLDPTRTMGESWRSAVHHRLGVNTYAWDPDYNQYNCFIHHLFGDPKQELDWGGMAPPPAEPPPLQGPLASFHVDVPPFTRTTDSEGVDSITIQGQPQLIALSYPEVPTHVTQIAFPRGYRIQNVALLQRAGLVSGGGVNLPPVVPAIDGAAPAPPPADPPPAGYWPAQDFAWELIEGPSNTTVLSVTVFPFHYDGATKQFQFYRSFDFSVNHTVSPVEIQRWQSGRAEYEVGSVATFHAWLWQQDTSSSPNVTAKVLILDSSRAVVETLAPRTLERLRGGHATCAFAWNSAGKGAGEYEAQLQIESTTGDLLARSTLSFRLGRPGGQIESVALTPGAFRAGQEVTLDATFANTGSETLDGTITLVVRDAAGTEVAVYSGTFSNLLPMASATFTQVWTSTLSPRNCEVVAYASFLGRTTPLWISRPWEEAPLLVDIDLTDAGRARVRWPSVSNRTYVLELCTNLTTHGFLPMIPPPVTTPPENLYTDSVQRIHGAFRVREIVP